ncbi:MAG: UvrD-helicase domain-containing protein [bacterium]|nr:MAG: UvrD-helicase domain-containing protein [bacterium]
MPLLRNLNSVQRQAVEKIEGPNLILAGAGSGKTRVLTHKIAYLIQRKRVKPENILAMTFTNKAANEMKDRVEALLKGEVKGLWIGTFHSLFARILRRNCEKLGYTSSFVVYDESDQLAMIKSVLSEFNLSSIQAIEPRKIRPKIKYLKNSNIPPEKFKFYSETLNDELFHQIFYTYQTRLQQNNAMDFEDLLLRSIDLFKLFPSVLDYYQNKFHYILVDEYQDTNRLQYELIKLLGQKHRNISVVGDDDQSIYRWRGAEIRNILDFEQDYSDCTVFKLEQNYRSTSNILTVAHSIISHNRNRMEKELWTKKELGDMVTFMLADDAHDEAIKIANNIEKEIREKELNFSDFAVLYRTNAQSRAVEEVLKNKGINYVIVGGIRFYERKEIKDMLAYLRVLVNPNDSISLKRIINYPARGIGEATVKKLEDFGRKNNLTLFETSFQVEKIDSIGTKTKANLINFHNLIKKYINLKKEETLTISELVATLIGELDIISIFKQEGTFEAQNRIENIRELLNGINEFISENPHLSLEHYLENIALITDVDSWDSKANAVSLLTLHSAKGLEFPVVFISGLEEGLFPLSRQLSTEEDLEEERRLFYVGATRAEEKLYLSAAQNRKRFGESSNGTISRFMNEIDQELLDIDETIVPKSSFSEAKKIRRPGKRIRFGEEEKVKKEFKPGVLVKHPRFGRGVIRSMEDSAEGKKLIIIFEEVGEKRVVLKYAKLEIV